MNLFVTTCGTSIFTNAAKDDLRGLLNKYANHRDEAGLPANERGRLEQHIETCRTHLKAADKLEGRRACAELNGLLSLGALDQPAAARDQHILIHTDTWLGRQAAELLREYLKAAGLNVTAQQANQLNTASLDDFQVGLGHLVDWAARTLPGYRNAQYRVVFNLVGGFKSLQGFMQTLGMFYADEIVYLFETGSQLLRVPRIPVNLDAAAIEQVRRHLPLFRSLSALGEPRPASELPTDLSELFVYRLDDQFELSPWGKLVWEQCRPKIYEERLLDVWSTQMRLTEAFRKDAGNLPPDRVRQLNKRLDDLGRYMKTGQNIAGLDLKPLRNNPKPPATHEADAWADGDCRRLFLHFEKNAGINVAVIDRLDKALH